MFQHNLLLKISCVLILIFPVFLQAQNPDLELTMTSNNPQVGIYDYITITSTIQNTGTESVSNAIVDFDIPTGIAIAGEFPPIAEQGTYEGFYGGSQVGNWFVGELAAGASLTFDLTLFTLSEDNVSFYGQVAQGGNGDPDSEAGNGTCCIANEDDEAAYTFPNDESDCAFDQAYAELVCDDNGTPDDPSDDAYRLRFRADGTSGQYSILINTLSYFQTFEYSTGFIELPLFSLEVETLELIFSDTDNTEACGETIVLDVPACAETDCQIIYNEISNTVDDMGTPDNIFDDTFTIVYTIENEGGGTGFVGQFGGQFCGQVPSVGTYGQEITFTANLANWGNGSSVGCQIVDNENPNCTGGYTLIPDVNCGFGNACADLELSAANTPTPGIYTEAYTQFVLENDFLGVEATGIQVTFNKNDLNIIGAPMVSQGSIDLYWTDNPVWNVGVLAPNQAAIIEFNLFTLADDYSLYGQVSMQNENDFDSTPNNGNGVTPQEDDEAIYSSDDENEPLPDLVISSLTVDNSIYDPNALFTFDFLLSNEGTLATSIGSTIGYWISEDNVLSPDDIPAGMQDVQAIFEVGESLGYGNFVNQEALNSLSAGEYFLILNADKNELILESNEINNIAAVAFSVIDEISCDLTISDTQLTCAENSNNSPFVYAIEVSGAAGNTVDYEILGTSFSGTIITNQLVNIGTLEQGLDFTVVVTDPNNPVCDYVLTSNIPIAPGVCLSDCSINISELTRACVDFGNPNSNISITATAVSSTGNDMNVTINGADVGTIESGISTLIYTTGQGAILNNIVFTDVADASCSTTTSSFQTIFPNECADVSCNIFEPEISNISCTETSLTFDLLVSGNNLSNDLELRAGIAEIAILPDVLTTVTVPREGTSTELLLIDLGFTANQFQDFCLRTFFVDCIPDPTEGADVTLSVSNNQNTPTGIYQAGEAIFTLTNTGTSPATGLIVTFTKNQINITGTPTTTAGISQFHWTDNPVWQLGTLAPGQSELIVFPVFTVSETFGLYGELTAMNEPDIDSTPNNGNEDLPIEDDEALWPNSDDPTSGFPDLVITNTTLTINSTEIGGTIDYSFTIENQGDVPNMNDFVYTGFVTDDTTVSTPYSVQGVELVTDVINPGQSITRSGTFTINSSVPDGYNYFGIIIDGGGNIIESNELNNIYLDGPYFFDETNNPCMVDLELVNINCTSAEGVYDLTVAMNAVNLFPINQTYTVLNGEFLGVAFSGDSDVRTFFDIPLDQVTEITTTDSAGDCIEGSLVVELDPNTDCDVLPQGVDLELTASISADQVQIYSTFSVSYTLTNVGNADASGIIVQSVRHPDIVFEGGNEFTASQGTFDYLGASVNSFWNVGNLAAGETATLTVNYFTLDTGTLTNYAYVVAQNEPDFDSNPNQWICCVPVEDDEAAAVVSVPLNIIGDNPSVALSNSNNLKIRAYPVPVQDYLTVELFSQVSKAVNLEILDLTGRSQIFQEVEGVKGVQTVEITVTDLEKGIYLLLVRQGAESVVQRFVKM